MFITDNKHLPEPGGKLALVFRRCRSPELTCGGHLASWVKYLGTQNLIGDEFRPLKLIIQAAQIKSRANIKERRELERSDYRNTIFEVENKLRIAPDERRKRRNRRVYLVRDPKLSQNARRHTVAVRVLGSSDLQSPPGVGFDSTRIDFPIALTADQTFARTDHDSSRLSFGGPIDLNGHTLTFEVRGDIAMGQPISGTGALIVTAGSAFLFLNAPNTFTGPTTVIGREQFGITPFPSLVVNGSVGSVNVGQSGGFIDQRASRIRTWITDITYPRVRLQITTNGGANMTVDSLTVNLAGNAPADIFSLVIARNGEPVDFDL